MLFYASEAVPLLQQPLISIALPFYLPPLLHLLSSCSLLPHTQTTVIFLRYFDTFCQVCLLRTTKEKNCRFYSGIFDIVTILLRERKLDRKYQIIVDIFYTFYFFDAALQD